MSVVIMRWACVQEDEGQSTYIKACSEEEAKNWIDKQKDHYFKPGDYYIMYPKEENAENNN